MSGSQSDPSSDWILLEFGQHSLTIPAQDFSVVIKANRLARKRFSRSSLQIETKVYMCLSLSSMMTDIIFNMLEVSHRHAWEMWCMTGPNISWTNQTSLFDHLKVKHTFLKNHFWPWSDSLWMEPVFATREQMSRFSADSLSFSSNTLQLSSVSSTRLDSTSHSVHQLILHQNLSSFHTFYCQ